MSNQPEIVVRIEGRKLLIVGEYDKELLAEYPNGSEFQLVLKKKTRSNRQQNYYWAALTRICKATGLYPKPRHLHEELLLQTGYFHKRPSLSTGVRDVPDSTSFNKMDHNDFTAYVREAKRVLLEHGIDLEALMGEPA